MNSFWLPPPPQRISQLDWFLQSYWEKNIFVVTLINKAKDNDNYPDSTAWVVAWLAEVYRAWAYISVNSIFSFFLSLYIFLISLSAYLLKTRRNPFSTRKSTIQTFSNQCVVYENITVEQNVRVLRPAPGITFLELPCSDSPRVKGFSYRSL